MNNESKKSLFDFTEKFIQFSLTVLRNLGYAVLSRQDFTNCNTIDVCIHERVCLSWLMIGDLCCSAKFDVTYGRESD